MTETRVTMDWIRRVAREVPRTMRVLQARSMVDEQLYEDPCPACALWEAAKWRRRGPKRRRWHAPEPCPLCRGFGTVVRSMGGYFREALTRECGTGRARCRTMGSRLQRRAGGFTEERPGQRVTGAMAERPGLAVHFKEAV